MDNVKLKDMPADQLLRIGKATYAEGDYQEAQRIWQLALQKDPHNEQLWLAMLPTLTEKEDRRVCLKNILAINPNNETASTLLELLESDHEALAHNHKFPETMRQKDDDRFRMHSGAIRNLTVAIIVLVLILIVIRLIVVNLPSGLVLIG